VSTDSSQLEHPFLAHHHALMASPQVRPATLEGRIEVLEAERAIGDLLASYATFYDSGDVTRLMSLFSEDAVLDNLLGTFTGTAQIQNALERLIGALEQRMHFITNQVIRVLSADQAEAASYLYSVSVMRKGHVMYGTGGTYYDKLAVVDGQWRIVHRRVTGQMAHQIVPLEDGDNRFSGT
jgi:ketosteroid isomerase-like protein